MCVVYSTTIRQLLKRQRTWIILYVLDCVERALFGIGVVSADIISTVEFNHSGDLLATGDKGGRVVIFQQETEVSVGDLTQYG